MKQIVLACLIAISLSACAQSHHGHRHAHHHHNRTNSDWVAPLIIGGIIGYAVTQNSQVQTPVGPPTPCAPGYYPITERIWVQDIYGRYVQVDRVIGCR
jgi:hypothetical protein